MADKIQTTWMWGDEATGGTMGAIIDVDAQTIQWIDQPGCACGDNMQEQPLDDFLHNGAIGYVPQEILDEMHTATSQIMGQIAES